MNLDKTKTIEIGGNGRTINVLFEKEFQQNWTYLTFTSSGIEFDLDTTSNITELNLNMIISDIENPITIWSPKKRNSDRQKIPPSNTYMYVCPNLHIFYWLSQNQVKQRLEKLIIYLLNLYGRINLRNLERKF